MTTDLRLRPSLVSRALLLRFVSIVGSSIGFYLPLSVVPLYAKQAGSDGGAGLATVALLLATVACELVTPRLVQLVGYRWALALGLTLLGAPTLLLTVSDRTWVIVAVSVVRGAGFAIAVVAGGAITATLIPTERRGEGLALVGIVGGIPGTLALPAGVWAAAQWGYESVFVTTAVVTLLALLSLPGLPRTAPAITGEGHQSVLAGLRNAVLVRPATIFAASAGAAGVLVTFLPLATTDRPAWVAAAALLAQPAASTVARWAAGRLGDRYGSGRLLVPGLVLAAAGMAAIAFTGTPSLVIGGALVFGAGFGVLQNATLALMYARVPAGGEGPVSAIWNAAYDLGMAAGALCAGLVVTSIGYPGTFLLAAVVILPALALVRRDRRP
ncbi:MFS transporter [Kutzneria kofuensis]|uniref:MFS family permease n=1 Tax=Kutzneria kofuensis TaxID=103725 RepID=A0A7W9KCA7_9PSEU|nr:MFS transporter [Kutzneria kofuensis]MBB5889978.1 MFS family permease [Kutzneria kofuensis]